MTPQEFATRLMAEMGDERIARLVRNLTERFDRKAEVPPDTCLLWLFDTEHSRHAPAAAWGAYQYAQHIGKGPQPELEPLIKMSGLASLSYARSVLKARWQDGERAILGLDGQKTYTQVIHDYIVTVLGQPWAVGEKRMRELALSGSDFWLKSYERWSEQGSGRRAGTFEV